MAKLGKSGVSIGYFDNEKEGAQAYDRAAIALLGDKATNLNFPNHHYNRAVCPTAPLRAGRVAGRVAPACMGLPSLRHLLPVPFFNCSLAFTLT